MSNGKDYYSILGVSKSASANELKQAYHKVAKECHPDRNPGDKKAEARFKEANEAYEVLKDDQKKAAYDRYGHDAFKNSQSTGGGSSGAGFNADVNDIFSSFFSDFMGGGNSGSRRPSSQQRGSDLKSNITISLEEAFKGIERSINFKAAVKCLPCRGSGSDNASSIMNCDQCNGRGVVRIQQGFFAVEQTCSKCQGLGQIIKNPCKKCHGAGRSIQDRSLAINIPAGIGDNTRIKLNGEGEAGLRGGSNGDLLIFVIVKNHPIYKVDGVNIHCRLPISFTTAALGGEISVPVIEGEKVKLKIPAGTQGGDQLKLKNKGMSRVRSDARGDMLAHIHVEVPKSLNKKQEQLLRDFAKESGDDNKDESGFFDKMKNLWS